MITYDARGYVGGTVQAIGSSASGLQGCWLVSDFPVDTPDTWTCAYCGQDNNADREKCHGCQAPRVRSE